MPFFFLRTILTRKPVSTFRDDARSIDSDIVSLDELAPARDLRLDVEAKLFRLHHHRVRTLPPPGLLYLGTHEDLVDFAVEPLDDLARRACWSHHADPNRRVVVGNSRFRDGGHIRQDRRARFAGRAECFYAAVLDGRRHRGHAVEHHI